MAAWNEIFPEGMEPTADAISSYIGSAHYPTLCDFIEKQYGVMPRVEYSKCSGAPGWNVKYKAGSRALCTLYPHEGYFTCLVCTNNAMAPAMEAAFPQLSAYTRALYENAKPMNGTRWLMVDVTAPEFLEDVKKLVSCRVPPGRSRING